MLLKLRDCDFHKEPYLTKAIPDVLIDHLDMRYFDKDGYEITALMERVFYEHNGVYLGSEIQAHTSTATEWFYDETESESGLVLDHSMIMTRWAFSGDARVQIEEASKKRPILNKLLRIKPKWGIDFSLDWVSSEAVLEVIHIEQDFTSYDAALAAKSSFENLVKTTDWESSVAELIRIKSQWCDLSSDDQSDFKAKFFNWHRAFDNLKVF